MSTRGVPEPWAGAMKAKSLTHRDSPSITRLANAAGLAVETTRQALYGGRQPEPETVRRLAEALGVPATRVAQWASQTWETEEPYAPPAEVALLSRRQREALDELIRAMAEAAQVPRGAHLESLPAAARKGTGESAVRGARREQDEQAERP